MIISYIICTKATAFRATGIIYFFYSYNYQGHSFPRNGKYIFLFILTDTKARASRETQRRAPRVALQRCSTSHSPLPPQACEH